MFLPTAERHGAGARRALLLYMSTRDEKAAEAGQAEAAEWYAACVSPKGRMAMTADELATGYDLRRVVGRSPSNRDWKAWMDAAEAELSRLQAAERDAEVMP